MLRFVLMIIAALTTAVATAQETLDVTIYDATGNPAAGVKIDVVEKSFTASKPETILKSVVVGDDGKVTLPVPPKAPAPGEPINVQTLRQIVLKATDPSGQSQQIGFPSTTFDVPPKQVLDAVYLAFVPRDATVPAFRGTVFDHNGAPLSSTTFSFNWMEFPGHGGKQFHHNMPIISPAPDGTFSVGIPKDFLQSQLGVDDTPLSSALRVNLSGIGTTRLVPDHDNVITIPYTEKVRFQLVDLDGNPIAVSPGTPAMTLRRLGEGVDMTKESPDSGEHIGASKQVTDPALGIIEVGPIPLPGNYSMVVEGKSYISRRIEKGAGSSALVQWTRSQAYATVKGRVLSAEDGTGLSGAYVVSANDQGTPYRLVKLEEEELKSIWNAWADGEPLNGNGSKGSIQLKNGETMFSVQSMAVSDSDGNFQLHFESGQTPSNIHVYVPRRVGASASLYHLKKDDLAISETILSDVSLPLAALVTLIAEAPEKIPDQFLTGEGEGKAVGRNGFKASISFERPGPWRSAVPPLNGSKDNPWTLINSSDWISPGNHVTLQAPAGIKLSASAYAPYHATLGTALWSDLGPLQPGEKLDLAAKSIPVKTPFLVRVKNKDGSPAVGMSVRIDGHVPITTDKEGAVIGWSSGHVGRIEVMADNTWNVAAEARDIEIPQSSQIKEVDLILK